MKRKRDNRARHVALGGVFAALSIVLMLVGGMLPIATFTAPIFASLCLVPVLVEMGAKTALLVYIAVALLTFLMVPDREMGLFFILLTGYYPILQPVLNRRLKKPLAILCKLLIFNGAVAAVYTLLLFLFTSPELAAELAERGWWFWGILLVMGNATFFLYDLLIDKVRIIYIHKLRRMFFR